MKKYSRLSLSVSEKSVNLFFKWPCIYIYIYTPHFVSRDTPSTSENGGRGCWEGRRKKVGKWMYKIFPSCFYSFTKLAWGFLLHSDFVRIFFLFFSLNRFIYIYVCVYIASSVFCGSVISCWLGTRFLFACKCGNRGFRRETEF